jgi:topoisomerase-4 subunit B
MVCSYREGESRKIVFSRGELVEDTTEKTTERNGTYVEFTPDSDIFGEYTFRDDFLDKRLRHFAFLNSGLKIQFNESIYESENGLQDLLEHEAGEEAIYSVFYYREKTLEFAFTHTHAYGERYLSFANGQYTSAGGSHLSAFKEGLLKGVNAYSSEKFTGDDVRDGIIAAISIKLKDPVFESQTKNKLGNSDIRRDIVARVQSELEQMLHRDTALANELINKIKANQQLRTELQVVQKKARARAKQTAIRIPKLKDCKVHLGTGDRREEESSIFLTEGLSAAGSLVSSRDVYTQAVYALKGKPLNVFEHRRDTVYKNEEIYNIMRALNIEGGVEGLRYNRVILATDADIDGLHIRNLLMTLFLHFFEDIVLNGHLFILETPLFRVRNKKDTVYCYTDAEKTEAENRLGKKSEVTRFKGLGEISPEEFGQFIGKDIRLEKVGIDRIGDVSDMLCFYMGKNTPERKQYIMDNLR